MFVAFTIHLHDLSYNLLHLHIGGMVRKLPLGHCLKIIDLLPERLLFNLSLIPSYQGRALESGPIGLAIALVSVKSRRIHVGNREKQP